MDLDKFRSYIRRMYVIEYAEFSDGSVSSQSVAKGSLFTEEKVEEEIQQLVEEGILAQSSRGKYESTPKAKVEIDDDIYNRISESYDHYLRLFSNTNVVKIGDEDTENSNYPMKSSVSTEVDSFKANYFGEVKTGVEKAFYLTEENSLPKVTDLSFRNLERLPILLIKILWVHVSDENKEYWALTYDTFKLLRESEGEHEVFDVRHSIRLLFNLTLSSIQPHGISSITQTTSQREHSREVLSNTNFLAAFVAYPALESYLKFKCRADFEPDGTIRRDKTIRDYRPSNDREFYSEGDTCSSIRDLLIHFEYNVADSKLQKELADMRREISKLVDYPEEKVWGLVYQWRNTLSHQATTDVKASIILNIICMIIWHEVNQRIE